MRRVYSKSMERGVTDFSTRIRKHYDLLAPVYYFLWGQHVHHGYWENEADRAPASVAQTRLITELYRFAGQPKPEAVLDVGCGYGGSLRWLADQTGARGTGLTLSRAQQAIARMKNLLSSQADALEIRMGDAQCPWPFLSDSFDLVWCVECSEHLRDRLHLAREGYRVLKPGGVFVLAAWLASPNNSPSAERLRKEVEKGMLCYPFASSQRYLEQARAAGFERAECKLITEHVARTWDLCIARRDQPLMRWLNQILGEDVRAFAASFDALRQAYLEGAMEYGFIVASKPGGLNM